MIISILLLPLAILPASVVSSASVSVAPVLSHAENLVMDTLFFHTSFELRIDTAPLGLRIGRFSAGPYLAVLMRSDSLEYGDIVFLGYSMASLGLQSRISAFRSFDIGLSLGAGEGRYSYNETLFALLESELFFEFPIMRPLRARGAVRYTRREGFSDLSLSLGIALVKDGPR